MIFTWNNGYIIALLQYKHVRSNTDLFRVLLIQPCVQTNGNSKMIQKGHLIVRLIDFIHSLQFLVIIFHETSLTSVRLSVRTFCLYVCLSVSL